METVLALLDNVDISEYLDIRLAFGLMGLGFCIKHVPFLAKVSNQFIPLILMISSLIISYANLDSFSLSIVLNTFVNSLFTASISIGLHQQGKGFFKAFAAINKYTTMALKDINDNNTTKK